MNKKVKWKDYKARVIKEMDNAFLASTGDKTIYLVKDLVDYEVVKD